MNNEIRQINIQFIFSPLLQLRAHTHRVELLALSANLSVRLFEQWLSPLAQQARILFHVVQPAMHMNEAACNLISMKEIQDIQKDIFDGGGVGGR